MRCWKNKIPQRPVGMALQECKKHAGSLSLANIQEFESFYRELLVFLDNIHIMQVKFYLKTEGLTESQLK
jgi:hypothetical protein